MSHSLVSNRIHIIFGTDGRKNTIPAERRTEVWAYMLGIGQNLEIPVIAVGGMSDHAHLLIALPPTMTLASAVQKFKANTSRFLGKRFEWQEGYAAYSVSASSIVATIEYIRKQEKHHSKRNFEQELREFARKNGIEIN